MNQKAHLEKKCSNKLAPSKFSLHSATRDDDASVVTGLTVQLCAHQFEKYDL